MAGAPPPPRSPAMERLSCAPSCRGEKETLVSRVGTEGGVAEDTGGGVAAPLWAVGGAAGRPPFRPLPCLPSHPGHRKGPGSFLWQESQPPARLPSPPTSSWGQGTTEGGDEAWWRSEQGRGWHCSSKGVRRGQAGAPECPETLPQASPARWPWSSEPRVKPANSSKESSQSCFHVSHHRGLSHTTIGTVEQGALKRRS